jgi:tRNA A37 threonylcarbamoyladenosine dehydratase
MTPNSPEPTPSRRFRGIARLYGEPTLAAFQRARVCVAGIGGVGSWAVEALARSGVGTLTLIDLDHVSESNINRQIHAVESNFGKAKVAAMGERIGEIDPGCRVHCVEHFVTPDNVAALIDVGQLDFVVDCSDQVLSKAAMVDHCRRGGCPIITVGGTGGQSDPTRIRVDDLSRSIHDPLLAKTRRRLRQHYGFRRTGVMGVKCVYSAEQARYPTLDGGVSSVRESPVDASLYCGGLGSAMHLTASFGLTAVAWVLDRLAESAATTANKKTGAAKAT